MAGSQSKIGFWQQMIPNMKGKSVKMLHVRLILLEKGTHFDSHHRAVDRNAV